MPKILLILLSLLAVGLGLLMLAKGDSPFKPAENYASNVQSDPLSRDARWQADLQALYGELQRRHPNIYYTTPKEAFDVAVSELNQKIPALTDIQIIAGMQKIVALVHDAHTQLDLLSVKPAIQIYPLHMYLFDDGLYVLDALSPYEQLIGARVISIEGKRIDEVYAAYTQYISAENDSRNKLVFPYRMRVADILHALGFTPDPTKSTWQFEMADGQMMSLALNAIRFDEVPESFFPTSSIFDRSPAAPLYLTRPDENFWLQHLTDSNSLYIQFNAVDDRTQAGESLSNFSKRVRELLASQQPDRVIVDLRHNGGGNNKTYGPLLRLLIENQEINQRGKLFVLIGRMTFSAAVNFAVELEFNTETIFIGETPGNRPHMYGDCNRAKLPYSEIEICISSRFWPKGNPKDDRLFIPPDISVGLSYEEFREHQDPALEAAINFR